MNCNEIAKVSLKSFGSKKWVIKIKTNLFNDLEPMQNQLESGVLS